MLKLLSYHLNHYFPYLYNKTLEKYLIWHFNKLKLPFSQHHSTIPQFFKWHFCYNWEMELVKIMFSICSKLRFASGNPTLLCFFILQIENDGCQSIFFYLYAINDTSKFLNLTSECRLFFHYFWSRDHVILWNLLWNKSVHILDSMRDDESLVLKLENDGK